MNNFYIVPVNRSRRLDRRPSLFVVPRPHPSASRNLGIVRRRITPEAGRGLEILGHALDYLADEFVCDGCRFSDDSGRLQAIQLLTYLNRQIYFACDVEPTFRDRAQSLFRWLFKQPSLRN